VKRRDALKAIVIGSATASVVDAQSVLRAVRLPEHAAHASAASGSAATAVFTPKYFSRHEFAVVSRLADLIIPRDTTPGALDAHVPEYIDLQVSKMPDVQTQISVACSGSAIIVPSSLARISWSAARHNRPRCWTNWLMPSQSLRDWSKHVRSSSWCVALLAMVFIPVSLAFKRWGTRGIPLSQSGAAALIPSIVDRVKL
jgi:hypothetical protein